MKAKRVSNCEPEELPSKGLGTDIAMERLYRRALDFYRTPTLIVSSRAELLFANEPGLKFLASSGCIRRAGGCITGRNPIDTARLLRQINRVANVGTVTV